ncbi:hypothetical protein ACJRO7_003539, partial [Eucalyptus globulus]
MSTPFGGGGPSDPSTRLEELGRGPPPSPTSSPNLGVGPSPKGFGDRLTRLSGAGEKICTRAGPRGVTLKFNAPPGK